MSCKHEPIEVEYRGAALAAGKRYMMALLFSDTQPPIRVDCARSTVLYAMMGCRHCKAVYIDVVPDLRVIDDNVDPYRSEGS